MDPSPELPLPPSLAAFAQRHRLGAEGRRADGGLSLAVDRRFRVRLSPAPHNRVALSARLMALGGPGDAQTQAMIERLAKAAAGLLARHASTLCIDARQQALQLQQFVPAGAGADAVEDALADFSNAMAFWSRLCRGEQAPAP